MRKHYTTPQSSIEKKDCEELIRLALKEDAPSGDATSDSLFAPDKIAGAKIIATESGVLCGLNVIKYLLDIDGAQQGHLLNMTTDSKDGDEFRKNSVILQLNGSLVSILRLERIILNFLQYLSGISTTVSRVVQEADNDIAIIDTRKTIPGYRRLAKYAVYCGGGSNHRIHLSDMIMIKDNHIAAMGSLKQGIAKIRNIHPDLPIEIEIDSPNKIGEALSISPDIILLDNMDRTNIEKSLKIIKEKCDSKPPFIEISGGWEPDRLGELSGLGRLGVSMGYLTHTTRFLDLSMEIISE